MYGLVMLREYLDEILDGIKTFDARVYDTNSKSTELVINDMPTPRRVPINSQLEEILMNYHIGVKNGNAFVLSNSENPYEPRRYQRDLKKIFLELEKDYTCNDLRDMFFIRALECGMNIISVSQIGGIQLDSLFYKCKELIVTSEDANQVEMTKLEF